MTIKVANSLGFFENLAFKYSDWLLPYAIKDSRQAISSRLFVGFFFIGIGVSLVSACVFAFMDTDSENLGRNALEFYSGVLDAGVMVVIPFFMSLAMSQERNDSTFELHLITALTPSKVVLGKCQSGIIQSTLYVSMVMPFIFFCYFLNGVSFDQIFVLSLMSFLVGQFVMVFAIFCSSVGELKFSRLFMQLVVLAGAVSLFFGILAFKHEMLRYWGTIPWSDYRLHTTLYIFFGFAFTVEWFLITISAAKLSPYTANRSKWPRIVFMIMMAEFIGCFAYFTSYLRSSGFTAILIVYYIVVYVISTFFMLEADELSKRQYLKLKNTFVLFKFIKNLFLQGRSSAIIFLYLTNVLVGLIVMLLAFQFIKDNRTTASISFFNCYIMHMAVHYLVSLFYGKFLPSVNSRNIFLISILVVVLLFYVGPLIASSVIGYRTFNSDLFYMFNFPYIVEKYMDWHQKGVSSESFAISTFVTLFTLLIIWVIARINMRRQVQTVRNYIPGERGA